MADEKPKQEPKPKDAQAEGQPPSVKEFTDKDGNVNLPDNPAYVAPESVDDNM